MNRSLKLSEKLFCLAVNPERGGILLSASSALGMTLAGAVFAELADKQLVSIEKKVVRLINPTIQADRTHEYFLVKLRLHGKPRKMSRWISYFNIRRRKTQRLIIRDLVANGVLRTEEHRILFIPYQKVYLQNRQLVAEVARQVEQTIFGTDQATEENIILALLVWKTNLLAWVISDRKRRKEAINRLKAIPETELIRAVKEAILIADAATFAAIS